MTRAQAGSSERAHARARARAWIRGVGAVSALGADWPSTAAALARGASGITPVTRFDATGMPCAVASTVTCEVAVVDPRDDRRVALARAAVREAWAAAGIAVESGAGAGAGSGSASETVPESSRAARDGTVPESSRATTGVAPERIGVFVGAESGLACFAAAYALSRAGGGGPTLDPERFRANPEAARHWADPRRTSPAAVADMIAEELGARGTSRTIALACASATAAILDAVRALRAGTCDVAVCVGVGADVDPLMMAAFGRLGALSARGRATPFDAARDGFVLGEGAAAIVLSVDRGDAVAEVAGGARTLDGGSLTAPDPDGRGAQRAIAAAIADAGVDRGAIGYVAAHGTATAVGDAVEAAALRGVLGDDLGGARVGAVKSALGHWVAGAGAIGALCAYHAVARGELLPTIGVDRIAPDCVLPHVLGEAAHRQVDAALVDSFGFGGANACVVVRSAT